MSAVIESGTLDNLSLVNKINDLENKIKGMERQLPKDQVSIIVLSGDFDKAMAAFMMANGAVGMGMEVTMFLLSGAAQ